MAVRISFSFLSITLLLVSTSALDKKIEPGSFGYSGANGPERWGSLSPRFSVCSNGKSQSPVDIKKGILVQNKNLVSLVRDYKPANATLINNGFNIGIHFGGNVGGFTEGGKNYNLIQIHWHSPSEHLIDGHQAAAELHLVHQANDGSYSVIGVLYEIGNLDPLVAKVQNKLVELAKENCAATEEAHIALGTFDVKYFRRRSRKYFRYVGSLTTPPCTENITWTVLAKVRSISMQQLDLLKAPLQAAYKNNARPVQPLNERKIEAYKEA
ncbi:Alpha carbonic anhydrase [Quillaja saponaria]|uniref:Alpha carbonic anhydrase n=1 Tax=Quillaja saponaria TaxID=32244 RepID=A0AAD7PYK8_QUISA|nr:Alpha carbonic anhydrase [Quillaja saponaria]